MPKLPKDIEAPTPMEFRDLLRMEESDFLIAKMASFFDSAEEFSNFLIEFRHFIKLEVHFLEMFEGGLHIITPGYEEGYIKEHVFNLIVNILIFQKKYKCLFDNVEISSLLRKNQTEEERTEEVFMYIEMGLKGEEKKENRPLEPWETHHKTDQV